MEYSVFKLIFDKHLQLEDNEAFVHNLVKDNNSFNRITTSFDIRSFEDRLTKLYLTSIGIKLGDAIEDVFKEYLIEKGAIFLPRDFVEGKDCDQIFQYNNTVFLVEQKIKDDHDSSKKIGQIENYQTKKNVISKKSINYNCCCWFIDPLYTKNQRYYKSVLNDDELYYGAEIEQFLKNKVFKDNRCDGFFDQLVTFIEKYTSNFSILNIQNLAINFKNFSISELYRLLLSKKHIDKIANTFFNGNIPFQEIYLYVDKSRSVPCTENFKKILKEYMKNE